MINNLVVISINTFFGTLNIPDNKWGYYILDTRTMHISNSNISNVLESIYLNTNFSFIDISIKIPSVPLGQLGQYDWNTVFEAKGYLYKDKLNNSVYDWTIADEEDNLHYLGDFLFNNTGTFVQIQIRNYVRGQYL